MFHSVLIAAPLFLIMAACGGKPPAERPAQPASGRVQVNGMQMYYEVSGAGRSPGRTAWRLHEHPEHGRDHPQARQDPQGLCAGVPGTRPHHRHRPAHHLPNLADDVAAFMDSMGLEKADVFGYSMGAEAGLQLAIRHPAKVNKLVAASAAYDLKGWQPEFTAVIPQMTVEMIVGDAVRRGVSQARRQSRWVSGSGQRS